MKKGVGYIISQTIRICIPKYRKYKTIVDECVFANRADAEKRLLAIVNKKIRKNKYHCLFAYPVPFMPHQGIWIDKLGKDGLLIKSRRYEIKMVKLV